MDLEAGEDIDASSSSTEDSVPDAMRDKTTWATERPKGRKELVMTAINNKYEKIAKESQPKKRCAKSDEVFFCTHLQDMFSVVWHSKTSKRRRRLVKGVKVL